MARADHPEPDVFVQVAQVKERRAESGRPKARAVPKKLLQAYVYFVIYYEHAEKDKPKSYKRAAEHWVRAKKKAIGYDKSRDRFIQKPVTIEKDFWSVWEEIHREVEEAGRKARKEGGDASIRAGAVFTHASPSKATGGMELAPSYPGGSRILRDDAGAPLFRSNPVRKDTTITRDDIRKLVRLQWAKDGVLELHGCRTGISPDSKTEPVAQTFATSQNVQTIGMMGFSYFSLKKVDYTRIPERGVKEGTEIYLLPYYRRGNVWYKYGVGTRSGGLIKTEEFRPK